MTDRNRATPHLVDVERFEGGAHADDIDDRVECADLVEFDLGGFDPVDRPFDLAEPHEHRAGTSAHPLGQVRRVEQRQDLAQRTMLVVLVMVMVVLVVDDDVGPRGANTAALDALEQQGVAIDAEATDGGCNHVGVGAGVDECGHRHVACDARLAVEPGDPSAIGCRRPRRRGTCHRFGHVNIRAMAHAAPKPLSMPTTVTPLAHEACIASSAVTPSSPAP